MNILKKISSKLLPKLAKSYITIRNKLTIKRLGVKITSHGFKFSGNSKMQSGDFEPEESLLLSQLLIESDVFVDVGANIGFYTCLAKELDNHVVAFEPDSENLESLFQNLELNGWNDCEIYPLGLSEKYGSCMLYGFGTGASILPNWADVPTSLHKTIPLTTLDIILSNRFIDKKVIVKIDVEGAELSVLKGSINALEKYHNMKLLIEICLTEHHPNGKNPNFYSTFELLDSYGYKATCIEGNSQRVSLTDAKRWQESGFRDFGGINFLFTKTI